MALIEGRPGAYVLGLAFALGCGSPAAVPDAARDAPVDARVPVLAQQAYLKSSNTHASDQLGAGLALSADGATLAVSPLNQVPSNANGAIYVFTRAGATWSQQAVVTAPNTSHAMGALALSADGTTLAAGATGEASAAVGIDGNQADTSASGAGAVYVFARAATTWSLQAYVKASNTNAGDNFGDAVALSGDGATLAVGAKLESSMATGIDGNQADNSYFGAGATYVFVRTGTTWSQQAYIKASNTGFNDLFGGAVALSADGATLAVGAVNEASAATGIDGNQADNTAGAAGAVYVFARSGTTWAQQAYVKASNTEAADYFGGSLALSADGARLAVGADGEDSAATGVDGDQASNGLPLAGAAYVFARAGTAWSQVAYVKASNTAANASFGNAIALAGDGSRLAVGAISEESAATGIDGNQADHSALNAGAAYVFAATGASWSQVAYVKASNTDSDDLFGRALGLSSDGGTLVVSAPHEASAATGVDGDQADNSATAAGAAYVFASP